MTFRLLLGLFAVGLAGIGAGAANTDYRPDTVWPRGGATAPGYGAHPVSAAAVDGDGRLFLFHRAPLPVLVFDADGAYLRGWGQGQFTSPHGCRVGPDGSLWLTDSADHRVMKFSPEGRLLLTLGVKDEPGEDAAHFNRPTDVAFGPAGDIYISDGYGNARIVRLDRNGKFVAAWGRKGSGEGEFNLPHSLVVDRRGRVLVADRENARIQVFTADGRFLEQWRDVGYPYGLALTPDDRLIVTDGRSHHVSVHDLTGKRIVRFGAPGRKPGELDLPHLAAVDGHGAVYICEVNGKRVQRFLPR